MKDKGGCSSIICRHYKVLYKGSEHPWGEGSGLEPVFAEYPGRIVN